MSDHVVVTGSGTARAVPDVVVLAVRVEVEDADASGSLARAAAASTALLEAAAAGGVADPDRRTTDVGVQPHWDADRERVIGYRAHQRVRLRVRDIAAVGDLLTALARAAGDAFRVDDLRFEVDDPSELLEQARAAAFADARSRAAQYADLAGRPLGAVLRVVEGDGAAAPVARGMAMAASMPVAAGESEVRAAVVVRFALGPA
jgi:uncharacterized protein YggE